MERIAIVKEALGGEYNEFYTAMSTAEKSSLKSTVKIV